MVLVVPSCSQGLHDFKQTRDNIAILLFVTGAFGT